MPGTASDRSQPGLASVPPRPRKSAWGVIVALGSIMMVLLLFPLATRVRDPGADWRPLGYALLGCLLAADVVLGVWSTRVWVKALAFLAAAACAFAIWQAVLLGFH